MKKENEKKVDVVKTWTITETTYEDGSRNMVRTNDGFSPIELMGLSEFVSWDVKEQMMGRINPDTIKREVIL